MNENIVVTTEDLKCDYTIIDMIFSISVKTRNAISQWGSSIKSVFGGHLGGYDKLLSDMRQEALTSLRTQAMQLGANAIIGIRFESAEVASLNAFQVAVYGTAVKTRE